MVGRLAEVVASALAFLLAGYALWPPGDVYWTSVAARIGDAATMAVVLALAAGVGAGVGTVSDVDFEHLAVGGGIAYAVGMAVVEIATSPDSPVHLILYGGLLVCMLLGAVGGRAGARTAGTGPFARGE